MNPTLRNILVLVFMLCLFLAIAERPKNIKAALNKNVIKCDYYQKTDQVICYDKNKIK